MTWIGYIVADTFAGRHCHSVVVLRETKQRFQIKLRSQVCATKPEGFVQFVKKDRVMKYPPSWAIGERLD